MTIVNAVILTRKTSLSPTDESFQTEHRLVVNVTRLLTFQKIPYRLVAVVDDFVGTTGKNHVEALDEVHEARHLLVADGNISGGLVGHMNVMFLLH